MYPVVRIACLRVKIFSAWCTYFCLHQRGNNRMDTTHIYENTYFTLYHVKGIVHPKMKILFLITLVVPNPYDLRSSSEHKLRYFWWNLRALWPSIDSKDTTMIKTQKRSKDIGKIFHVTSVVQLTQEFFSPSYRLPPFWRVPHERNQQLFTFSMRMFSTEC